MPSRRLCLKDGSKIAVIGAGPAGSFFAHFATKLARQRGIDVSVTLFDGKDFRRPGLKGCNMCAGVISERLLTKLSDEGISLPPSRVQRQISSYWLHTPQGILRLTHPGARPAITTVYRGNGPQHSLPSQNVSFDDFLVDHACQMGATLMRQPVKEITLPRDAGRPVILSCGSTEPGDIFEADLVVGAFGLDTAMISRASALGFGYVPPKTVRACQAELELGESSVDEYFGDCIRAFVAGMKPIRFGTLIPKSRYVTVSLVGTEHMDREDLTRFLQTPPVRQLFPPRWELPSQFCLCRPRVALTPARNPFTDRFVIIGDASFSRYYKNGIESAMTTAMLAARTAFEIGISRSDFEQGYLRRAKQHIIRDNHYGRLLFRLNDFIWSVNLLGRAYINTGRYDTGKAGTLLRYVLWNMFTGNVPYTRIFRMAVKLPLQTRIITNVARAGAHLLLREDTWPSNLWHSRG